MAKKNGEVVRGAEQSSPDGSRAIRKFRISDYVLPVSFRFFMWVRNLYQVTAQ